MRDGVCEGLIVTVVVGVGIVEGDAVWKGVIDGDDDRDGVTLAVGVYEGVMDGEVDVVGTGVLLGEHTTLPDMTKPCKGQTEQNVAP